MKWEEIRQARPADLALPVKNLERYAYMLSELGMGEEAQRQMDEIRDFMETKLRICDTMIQNAPPVPTEPDTLEDILRQRPSGRRRLTDRIPDDYKDRLMGALLGRGAGCTLGAPLEGETREKMSKWARYCGDNWPLTDYWSKVRNPYESRYITGTTVGLTKGNIDCIPMDDDTAYTLIGLLTLEEKGPDFTPEQMLEVWQKYMPLKGENGNWGVCWGERSMLQNLEAGMSPLEAGHRKNPQQTFIAAWTRADTWGYVCPGWPEKAAQMAYRDASVNHVRGGVYGEMFFAAAIAAAFTVEDPLDALRIGLEEIPQQCLFADGIRWALGQKVTDAEQAAELVEKKYPGMFSGHAVNNAALVVLGLKLGDGDFTRTIGETVAMGLDNDCTAATAGSILGAVMGSKKIPSHWTKPFCGRIQSYFKGLPPYWDLGEVAERYLRQAEKITGGI